MPRPTTQSNSPFRVQRAGDLVLPPPVPQPVRGHHLPPPLAEIIRRVPPFCQKHGITRLEIFGSVARGDATAGSDIDLIATFPQHPGLEIVSMEEECARLLGVPVHLLTAETVAEMTNPYRQESIQRDRCIIYAG